VQFARPLELDFISASTRFRSKKVLYQI